MAKMKGINLRFVWLCYFSLFLLGLADNLRGPLYPEVMRELQLNDFQGSLLWGIASGFAFLGCLLTPWLLKKSSLRMSFLISMFLMLVGQWCAAGATHFGFAAFGSLSLGLSFGFFGVLQNALILRAGPPESLQRLQAGLHSQYAIASLLAPLLLSGVSWLIPGWRVGAAVGAAVSSLGFVVLIFTSKNLVDSRPADSAQKAPDKKSGSLRTRALWAGSILGFYVLVEIMVSSRLALFLRREAGFDFEQSSLATSLFFVGLLSGRLLFIFWQPVLSLKHQLTLSHFVTLLLLILGFSHDPRWLVLTGFSMAPFYPLAMAYIGSRFHSDEIPMVASIALSLNSLLVVLMHLGVGRMTESFGILKALWLGPFAILCSLLFLYSDDWLQRKVSAT